MEDGNGKHKFYMKFEKVIKKWRQNRYAALNCCDIDEGTFNLEPVISGRVFVKRLLSVYEDVMYEEGLCLVARTDPEADEDKLQGSGTGEADILCQMTEKYV